MRDFDEHRATSDDRVIKVKLVLANNARVLKLCFSF